MTKLKDINFQNFDVVTFENRKDRAIYLDERFYFSDKYWWTTEEDIKNVDIYQVSKIYRSDSVTKSSILRLFAKGTQDSENYTIYDAAKKCSKCSKCGQILEEN